MQESGAQQNKPTNTWDQLIPKQNLTQRGMGLSPFAQDLQSPNFKSGSRGWRIKSSGDAEFQNVNIGTKIVTIQPGDSIQNAIDIIHADGGGTLKLKSGTYVQTADIVVPSSIQIEGENTSTTTIVFSGSTGITLTGGNIYTTGTLSVNKGSTSVTGSGTTWVTSMIGRYIFISDRWYLIANVGSTTSITLATAMADANVSGGSYRISSIVRDVEIRELTITGSDTTGIVCTDTSDLLFEDLVITACNKAVTSTNFMNYVWNRVIMVANDSNGMELTNGSFFNAFQCPTLSNGGSGVVLDTVKISVWEFSASNANTADGVNATTLTDAFLVMETSGNGGQGVELVSGSNNNSLSIVAQGNTSDGIKLTATSDENILSQCIVKSNGGYGINIAASTCDDNILMGVIAASNTSGSVSDSGTGTLKSTTVNIIP